MCTPVYLVSKVIIKDKILVGYNLQRLEHDFLRILEQCSIFTLI